MLAFLATQGALALAKTKICAPPRDIGITKEVSAKDLVTAKGISKSQAAKYLRIITGRKVGTGKTLRAPVGEVERYFASGCPAVWIRNTWRAGR
jgi:hypothetical protein